MWNWQQKDWAKFTYEESKLSDLENKFLHNAGLLSGSITHVNDEDKSELIVNLISNEAIKTSEIEGDYLSKDSVQSSIRRQFGLNSDNRRISPAEKGIAEMMISLYKDYALPLTEQMLFNWHVMLTYGRQDLNDIGRYRTHEDPMEIISGRLDEPKIHFEAPPSRMVAKEMKQFIKWFNNSTGIKALTRAGIAHLYFEIIHPFEDGNGRLGRALVEKSLSQNLNTPTLIALSHTVEHNKKTYYALLEKSNKSNHITDWLIYFANTILEAQNHSIKSVEFLIHKAKLFDRIGKKINERQRKALLRIYSKGIDGFQGGLSADNYISITKTSKATATRDLKQLLELNALIKTGKLKSTRYYLNLG